MAENLAHLMATSLGFGAVIALLLLLRRVLDGRFAPTWWRQVWSWLLVAMFLYLPTRSLLTEVIPSLIQVDTPQAVVDGAYDRYNAYLWDHEQIVAAGSGGAGGATTMTPDGNMWYRHYVHYEDAQGQDVTIRDNDYLRSVTVDGVTTYTVHWTGVAYLVYIIVAFLLFAGGLVRYRLFRRRCMRWSTLAGAEDLAALEERKQALGLKQEVELHRCSLIHTPLLMGFLHPVILLPENMPQGSLDTALAHELTHLKSRDTFQLLLASLVRAEHWFNPMVWLMVRRLHREIELCCDYTLLKGRDMALRRAYGQAILEQMAAGDKGLSQLTTGFSGDKHEVFARFRAMMDTSPKHRGRIAMAAALVVVALAGSLVGCQTGTQEGLPVTLAEGIEAPQAVTDYAREYVEEQSAFYAEKEGYEITKAEIVGLTAISTGSSAENSGVSMYRLEYRLKTAHPEEVVLAGGMTMEDGAITEWGSAGQPYLLLYWEDSGEETTWEPLQITHTLPIEENYGTPEILEEYGDAYTAAAVEYYRSWRNAKKGPEPFFADMLSQAVYDALAREWEAYDQLSEEERLLSSHIPGNCHTDFEDWTSCEEFLGLSIPNPLEDSDWLEKGTYVGMPEGFRDAPRVRVSWYGNRDGHVEWLSVQSGYRSGDLRVTLDAMLYGDSPIGKPTDSGWSVELERQSYLAAQTGDTPLIVKDEGEQYVSLTAHFVQGYVLYRLDVIGTSDVQGELQETLERALESFT